MKLLVNADDFGRHPLINRAVGECFERGILRSATLMPGGKAFDDAVEIARSHPALGVGIHLTLVNGFPVRPPEDIPSLVTKDGVFLDDYTLFVKHFLQRKVNLEDVRRELSAQAEKMKKTGLTLTHIDSHQHMHVLPGIIRVALEIASSIGLSAVRIPRTPIFTAASGSVGQLIGRAGLATLARLAALEAKRKHFRAPDHFAGIVAGEAVQEGHFTHIVENLKPGVTEVMMHPGMDDSILIRDCAWDHGFEAERDALLSAKIRTMLEKKQIELINFKGI